MAYVYGHYRADTGELFYIGKGTANRAWSQRGRTEEWHKMVMQSGYNVVILADNLSESEAYTKERELIEEVGLDKLVNIVHGGNWNMSTDEWRRRVSEGLKRKYATDESYREKNKMLAKWKSENEEYRQAAIEKASDPEWRKKVSDGLKRKHKEDPTYRAKISKALKGKSHSEERKHNISQGLIGRKQTDAEKQKRSQSGKRYWAKRKAEAEGLKITKTEQKPK